MRRLARAGTRADLLACAELLERGPDEGACEDPDDRVRGGVGGPIALGPPDRLVQAIAASGGGSLPLRVRQGDAEAIAEALAVVADPDSRQPTAGSS